jgi:hypothetical protein
MESVTRRRLLATSAFVGTGYAGCLGRGSDSHEETNPGRLEDEPPNVPPKLECADGALREHCREANTTAEECEDPDYNRHRQMFDESALQWGDETGLGWRMDVDDTEVQPGETVTITMRNVSAEEKHYGPTPKYNLQVYTEAGWEDIRILPSWYRHPASAYGYHDYAQIQPPGGAEQWTMPLDPEATSNIWCPFPEGRYRCAYYGLFDVEDTGYEAIAVAFDVVSR